MKSCFSFAAPRLTLSVTGTPRKRAVDMQPPLPLVSPLNVINWRYSQTVSSPCWPAEGRGGKTEITGFNLWSEYCEREPVGHTQLEKQRRPSTYSHKASQRFSGYYQLGKHCLIQLFRSQCEAEEKKRETRGKQRHHTRTVEDAVTSCLTWRKGLHWVFRFHRRRSAVRITW